MSLLGLLGDIGKQALIDLITGTKSRENKLLKLREKWDGVPKGTPVVFDAYVALHQILAGGTPWSGKPLPYHFIKPGQGAMLMQIFWPLVSSENYKEHEKPVRFVLWCNQGYYEYIFLLSEFGGTLPFHVLA